MNYLLLFYLFLHPSSYAAYWNFLAQTQNKCLCSPIDSTGSTKFRALDILDLPVPTESTSTRTFNTNFTPSTTTSTFVFYTVTIASTVSLGSSQTGTVQLLSDTNATPTTVRAQTTNGVSGSLSLGLNVTNTQTGTLAYYVPVGHNVRLASSGTSTITLVNQTEVAF